MFIFLVIFDPLCRSRHHPHILQGSKQPKIELIYSIKRRGPNTHPWGTLQTTTNSDDVRLICSAWDKASFHAKM